MGWLQAPVSIAGLHTRVVHQIIVMFWLQLLSLVCCNPCFSWQRCWSMRVDEASFKLLQYYLLRFPCSLLPKFFMVSITWRKLGDYCHRITYPQCKWKRPLLETFSPWPELNMISIRPGCVTKNVFWLAHFLWEDCPNHVFCIVPISYFPPWRKSFHPPSPLQTWSIFTSKIPKTSVCAPKCSRIVVAEKLNMRC